ELMLFLEIFQYKNHIWHINKKKFFLVVSLLSIAKGPYDIHDIGLDGLNASPILGLLALKYRLQALDMPPLLAFSIKSCIDISVNSSILTSVFLSIASQDNDGAETYLCRNLQNQKICPKYF